MKQPMGEVFEFDSFRLVPSERLLLDRGAAVRLTARAFDLLLALVVEPEAWRPRTNCSRRSGRASLSRRSILA